MALCVRSSRANSKAPPCNNCEVSFKALRGRLGALMDWFLLQSSPPLDRTDASISSILPWFVSLDTPGAEFSLNLIVKVSLPRSVQRLRNKATDQKLSRSVICAKFLWQYEGGMSHPLSSSLFCSSWSSCRRLMALARH